MKLIITEEQYSLLNEDLYGNVKNLAGNVVNTVSNTVKPIANKAANVVNTAASTTADALVAAGDKVGLGTLKSDWWYAVPVVNALKMNYDTIKGLRLMAKQTFEQNMEMIRQVGSGTPGTVVAMALDAIGIGEIVEPAFWSLFFQYDSWLASTGKVNILYMLTDFINVITAGVGALPTKKAMTMLGWKVKYNTVQLAQAMKAKTPELFKTVLKFIKNYKSVIAKITVQVKMVISKLIQKLPIMADGLKLILTSTDFSNKTFASLENEMQKISGTQLEKLSKTELEKLALKKQQNLLAKKTANKIVDKVGGKVKGKVKGQIKNYGKEYVSDNNPNATYKPTT